MWGEEHRGLTHSLPPPACVTRLSMAHKTRTAVGSRTGTGPAIHWGWISLGIAATRSHNSLNTRLGSDAFTRVNLSPDCPDVPTAQNAGTGELAFTHTRVHTGSATRKSRPGRENRGVQSHTITFTHSFLPSPSQHKQNYSKMSHL